MTKNLMQYTVATNFDCSLIDFINEHDLSHQIKSVYGKLPSDILGGGRPTLTSPKITLTDLKEYVQLCNQSNLSFNYLLNGLCTGAHEIMPETHHQLIKLIDQLCNIGVSSITVASPYLCELIKSQFQTLSVSTSLFSYPHHLQDIQYWVNLGADEITLPHHFNRNFAALKQVLMHYKNTPVKFRLIANNSCLHFCPYALSHACNLSHQSQTSDTDQILNIDYNLLKCKSTQISTPAALLASEWIRPEDIHYYTELCEETGNFNLSLKLVERTKDTAFLKNVVTAYLNESYKGNLIDILNWPSNDNTAPGIDRKKNGAKAIRLGYSLQNYIQYSRCLTLPPFNLDNTKLDGFLEHFIHDNHCQEHLCGLTHTTSSSDTCFYCFNWAQKAINYHEADVSNWLKEVREVFHNMKSSAIFDDSSNPSLA